MNKSKNYPLNDVVKVDSIAHMIELCVKDAGDKTAFMFKQSSRDEVHTRTYKEFAEDVRRHPSAYPNCGIVPL